MTAREAKDRELRVSEGEREITSGVPSSAPGGPTRGWVGVGCTGPVLIQNNFENGLSVSDLRRAGLQLTANGRPVNSEWVGIIHARVLGMFPKRRYIRYLAQRYAKLDRRRRSGASGWRR